MELPPPLLFQTYRDTSADTTHPIRPHQTWVPRLQAPGGCAAVGHQTPGARRALYLEISANVQSQTGTGWNVWRSPVRTMPIKVPPYIVSQKKKHGCIYIWGFFCVAFRVIFVLGFLYKSFSGIGQRLSIVSSVELEKLAVHRRNNCPGGHCPSGCLDYKALKQH